jgi:hypothetical protein
MAIVRAALVLVLVCHVAQAAEIPSVRGGGAEWLIVEAEDARVCQPGGETSVVGYPPQKVLILKPEASLTLRCDAGAVYLRLPMEFTLPGPGYGLLCDPSAKFRASVDGRVVSEFIPFRMPREFALAEGLPAGPHAVELRAVGGPLAVDGFRLAARSLSRVQGLITADQPAMELLVDVRAEVFEGERLARSEITRTPHDGGSFVLMGLAPGTYRVRFTAAGWEPIEVPAVRIEREGAVVDLAVLTMRRDQWARGQSWYGDAAPHFGRTITVAPGGSFRTRAFFSGTTIPKVVLKSRFKTVRLQAGAVTPENWGRWNGVGTATFTVPADAPHDMYALQVGGRLLPQAVCVREALPEQFFLAGVSHFHVWGQRQSERMAQLAEMAQLAGARAFMMANEVNAAYIVGALKDLRLPYVTCRGNHMMGRWSDFFGWSCAATDDGPMCLVGHGGFPYESWAEPREVFQARPGATCRVVVCYEGFAPIDFIREAAVDMLFDGHSDDPHPDLAQFPKGTLHFRAPGGPYIRWIPMTHQGLAPSVSTAKDIPLLHVPYEGPPPLRVEWACPNDGTARENTARLINETEQPFPTGRLRLVMAGGKYEVTGATVLQAFDAEDGRRVVDVQVVIPAKAETRVGCRPAA